MSNSREHHLMHVYFDNDFLLQLPGQAMKRVEYNLFSQQKLYKCNKNCKTGNQNKKLKLNEMNIDNKLNFAHEFYTN